MTQASLDLQLGMPVLEARDRLRDHVDALLTAKYRAANQRSRVRSIVCKRKVEHSHQWFACIVCSGTSPPWSSATNPHPKWAERWRRAHRAGHCDVWLDEHRYAIPGIDRAFDMVLGDALILLCEALGARP